MPAFQVILLPKTNYYDWLAAARDYGAHFSANFTNDLASAGNYLRPKQTITLPAALADPARFYGEDPRAWFAAHYPEVKLDVLWADTPTELKVLLDERARRNDQFARVQNIAPPPLPSPVKPPAPSPAPQATHGVMGTLRLKENKPTYATRIENIFFIEEITNLTDQTIPYGIIGVKVTPVSGAGEGFFHTSWSGDLKLGPHCKGPTDACGGAWEDSLRIEKPGTYRLTLDICFSSKDAALRGEGEWETLTPGLEVTAVDWTPPG